MAEELNTNNEPSTGEPAGEPKTYSKEQYDSLKGNLVSQIGERDTRVKELEDAEAKRVADAADAEAQKLAENNQHKELLEKSQSDWKTKEEELLKSVSSGEARNANLLQDNALAMAGIKDEVQIEGLKAIYRRTENAPPFAEWLTAQKVAPAVKAISSGNVPPVNPDASSDDLETRLKSDDPKIKREAIMEQGRLEFG